MKVLAPKKQKNLQNMVIDEDRIQPGSPVKNLEEKLSPYKQQLKTDLQGKIYPKV